jgi:hypothetical protein
MKKGKASMDDKLFSCFLDWFANSLNEQGFHGKHILLIDNHDSHERSQPIQVAMKNNVILMTFPSHCTHLVQMLDLSFFKPLKQAWQKVSRNWVEEECTDLYPYISKPVFITLFHRAWRHAAVPDNAINGWKKMGLSVDKGSGLLRIDRLAIPDRLLAASEKYEIDKPVQAQQSVRLCVGFDAHKNPQFEDFDFDLSQEGLDVMKRERPELFAMFQATKTYMLSQPGMPLTQPTVKPTKIARPTTQLLTTSDNLVAAQEKDARKQATTKKKKTAALAQIGNELGVTVMVDGINVVEEYNTRGTRKHFCPYCKMTLTRLCAKQKCKDLRDGKEVADERENTDGSEIVVPPPVNALLQVDVVTGKGRNVATETFFCTVQEYESDGAVFLLTQDGESMNIFLDDYTWKRVYQCVECQHYGEDTLKCDACGLERICAPEI